MSVSQVTYRSIRVEGLLASISMEKASYSEAMDGACRRRLSVIESTYKFHLVKSMTAIIGVRQAHGSC